MSGIDYGSPPSASQIEVTLFGPGVGECVLVHLGSGNWLVVDSCVRPKSKVPIAAEYLECLGFDVSDALIAIVASHWDDDHIRGLADLLRRSPKATFIASAALTREEFIGYVERYAGESLTRHRSGVREMQDVLQELANRRSNNQNPKRALADRVVLRLEPTVTPEMGAVSVTTLSPSDKQFEGFLEDIVSLMPQARETKKVARKAIPNHVTAVLWIEIGETQILLGGDLEETNDGGTGWTAIVQSHERPRGTAEVFKVPHHGSPNAHNDQVWATMLLRNAQALVAPYSRGRRPLPGPGDEARIAAQTSYAHVTSTPKKYRTDIRRQSVEATIRQVVGKLRRAEMPEGAIRLRKNGADASSVWSIEYFGNARSMGP